MLTNIFYQNPYWFWAHSTPNPSSESIPNFPFFYLYIPFPPSIAFTQKQNQKARHSCRAQNSQKQTRAQLSCLLLSPLSFPFQPSAKPFGNFPLYFHCFRWTMRNSKEPQIRVCKILAKCLLPVSGRRRAQPVWVRTCPSLGAKA